MALLDTAHRVSIAHQDRARAKHGRHPAISLAAGFGFIIVTAMVVHVTMAALL